jgi:hypothetical protein
MEPTIDGKLFKLFTTTRTEYAPRELPMRLTVRYTARKINGTAVMGSRIGFPKLIKDWGWIKIGFSGGDDHRMLIIPASKSDRGAFKLPKNLQSVIGSLATAIFQNAGIAPKGDATYTWKVCDYGQRWAEIDMHDYTIRHEFHRYRKPKGGIADGQGTEA